MLILASVDPCCMSDDGGSPRPPESQMDVEIGNNSCISGPIAPVSPVPSTNSKGLSCINILRRVVHFT